MSLPVWQDRERLPGLSPAGQRRLQSLLEHPRAPLFRNRSGHRLHADELKQLQALANEELAQVPGPFSSAATSNNAIPQWLSTFLQQCAREVPYYRQYLPTTPIDFATFRTLPTLDRGDLHHDIARFVPDALPLDRLFKFTTTGTTGHSLTIPTHPLVAAQYAIFHQKALAASGVEFGEIDSDVAIMLAGFQERCFTYLSVVPALDDRALLKLNFHPADWHNPDDRQVFIDAIRPALITGDPLSLHELSQLPFCHSPKAALSTSMTLTNGQQARLEARFGCPVIDVYSMNEAGPIGVRTGDRQGFRLLQSRLQVEILDAHGNVLAEGQRGEITLTGGFNHYLPLVRYRTGDYARLCKYGEHFFLEDFDGRPPVRYRTSTGTWINNIEITHALQPFPLPQFAFHQNALGEIQLRVLGHVSQPQAIIQALQAKLGADLPITIHAQQRFADKVIQYTSDLPGALP